MKASSLPSGESARRGHPFAKGSLNPLFQEPTCQKRYSPPCDTVTSHLPSGLNQGEPPVKSRSRWPLRASHTVLLLPDADTAHLPSGLRSLPSLVSSSPVPGDTF